MSNDDLTASTSTAIAVIDAGLDIYAVLDPDDARRVRSSATLILECRLRRKFRHETRKRFPETIWEQSVTWDQLDHVYQLIIGAELFHARQVLLYAKQSDHYFSWTEQEFGDNATVELDECWDVYAQHTNSLASAAYRQRRR